MVDRNLDLPRRNSWPGRPGRTIGAFAIAIALLGVCCWIVVPGPTLLTLAFGVVTAEGAPIALPIGLLLTLIVARLAAGRVRVVVVLAAVTADLCLAWPLVAFPFASQTADQALNAAGFPAVSTQSYRIDESRGLPVALRDGATLALDLYRPASAGAHPLLVVIYGGDWQFGTRAGEAPLAYRYAAQGFAVAVLDYRHAPRYRFPTQLEDVEDALSTIAAHARAWHIDPQRVALLGRSAGGQLALLVAERPQALRVRGVVAFYAPTDLAGGWATPPRPDPVNVRTILDAYLGGPPDAAHRRAYEDASPAAHVHAGMPPVLLVVAGRDELVLPRFQRAFAAKTRAAGVNTVAVELPWSNHAFDKVEGLGAHVAEDATARFLRATLR